MKFTCLLLALVTTYSAPLTAEQTSTPKTQKQILHDFRVDRPSAPPKIPLATQKNVLSKVFPRYLTDDSKCNPNFEMGSNDPLKSARDAGQIVPSIVDIATGSFSTAGKVETLYVISVSECNASHAENFGTKRVAIFAGHQLVANLDVDYRSSIVRKTDLDGDGAQELLMASSDMAQGTLTEMAALVDFQNGRLRVIEDFGTVNEDSCASEAPGSSSTASVISILNASPGGMPELRMDNYVASCRKGRRWKFLSTGKME